MRKTFLLSIAVVFLVIPLFAQTDVLSRVDAMMDEYAAQDRFAGIVLVAQADEPVYTRAIGYLNREEHIPHRADTRLKIGSIVKDFTAVAILQLMEQGRLRLDDPIGNYLDGFPAEVLETVTIRQLLQHRAGFGDYLMIPGTFQKLDSLKSVADIMRIIKKEPLRFEPGTDESYSNSGFTVLGAVIERLTGQSYAAAIKEMILAPLGMNHTHFDWHEVAALPQRPRYYIQNALSRFMAVPFDEWPSPSGGAYSTVTDLLTFELSLLYDNRLLSDAAKTITANGFAAEPTEDWQTIVNSPGGVNGKAGGSNGSNAVILSMPAEKRVIIALANYDEPIAEVVGRNIYTIITRGRYDPPGPDVYQALYNIYKAKGGGFLQAHFDSLSQRYRLMDPPDMLLNRVGYDLLTENLVKDAIRIFSINTTLFPEIANTWDSLGEAYMRNGNTAQAIRHYQQSLALNPDNENARRMLQKLTTD